jgi:hypothetical protein
MPQISNGWVSFRGEYACTLDEIIHVYASGSNTTRIVLRCGRDFHVPEPYADVMRAILQRGE